MVACPSRRTPLAAALAALATSAPAGALAQSAPPPAPDPAVSAWRQASGGTVVPELVPQPDGSTKLEWRSTGGMDGYRNDIVPPPAPPGSPPLATGLRNGDYERVVITTDARWTGTGGDVTYVQAGLTGSGDRAVLSRYSSQVTTLQVGRTTAGFQLQAGDAPVNLSPLSSMLALRGVNLTRTWGDWTLAGFGGVVSESWESLANRTPLDGNPARTRYLRSVWGVKGERKLLPGLSAFATAQAFGDERSSLDTPSSLLPADARAYTAGLAWQDGAWSATAEAASSRFEEGDNAARGGHAWVVDGAYRAAAWNARLGFHDVNPRFVSLSQAVPPGVREGYVAADWTAAPWLMLGADLRDSTMRTAETVFQPPKDNPDLPVPPPIAATSTRSRTATLRATANGGASLPGWNFGLTDTETRGEDAQGADTSNGALNATVSWSGPTGWTASLTATRQQARFGSSPSSDSDTLGGQLTLGRQWFGAAGSLGVQLGGGGQRQSLIRLGQVARSRTATLAVNGSRPGWGQLSLQLGRSIISQPMGGPDLVTDTVQLEIVRPITAQYALRAFWREARRNQGAPLLRTDETAAGLGLNATW